MRGRRQGGGTALRMACVFRIRCVGGRGGEEVRGRAGVELAGQGGKSWGGRGGAGGRGKG